MKAAPLIGLLVALLLTAAFWFFLYQPQNERQGELEAEIATLQGQESSLRARIEVLQAIRDDEVQIRAALARAEEYIPGAIAQPSALRQLQSAADAAGATLEVLTFGNPQPPATATGSTTAVDTGEPGRVLAAIPVTVVIDGGYFQIVDFLRRVEFDFPRAMLIQDITVEKTPDGTFPRLRATMETQLFAIVAAEALPSAAGAAPAPAGGDAAPTPTPSPSEAAG